MPVAPGGTRDQAVQAFRLTRRRHPPRARPILTPDHPPHGQQADEADA
jgi:hypothetical protein